MVILIIWHDGILRAFGIGVLSGLVFNGVLGLIAAIGPGFRINGTVVLATHLGLIQLSGLLCAAYVGVLEQSRRNAELEKKETRRQVR
jgi:Mg/Co/Ni transporter MgtE